MSENERTESTAKALPCAVVRDLLPLYLEKLTDEETGRLVQAHVSGCPACAQVLGAQQARLEMAAEPKAEDKKGVRYLKKMRHRRSACILLSLVLILSLVYGGIRYFNDVYSVDLSLAGQYQLSDGRIVLALRGDGVTPGQCIRNYGHNDDIPFLGVVTYQHENDQREPEAGTSLIGPSTTNWKRWFGKTSNGGEYFFYVFDPEENLMQQLLDNGTLKFPDSPDDYQSQPVRQVKLTVVRQGASGGTRIFWKKGDEVVKLNAEEEAVLLAAIDELQVFYDGRYSVEPQEDALTVLMSAPTVKPVATSTAAPTATATTTP